MSDLFKKLEEYNFWSRDGGIKTGFQRTRYLEMSERYLGNNLIKVILGQRRVGKSYLLRQIIEMLINKHKINPKNIFYLNKELIAFDDVKNYSDLEKLIVLYKKKLRIKGTVYLFLDEIQEIDGWERLVNSFSQDYKNEYELFITGSNSNMLSSELATHISGRYVDIPVYPFSFEEYIGFFGAQKNKESYLKYLSHGGLPELYQFDNEESKQHYIGSLLDTIILNDVVARYTIRDVVLLETIFKFLARNVGSLFSIKKIVNFLNSASVATNIETVSHYISYLCNTFLIHQVDRYDIRGKKIFATHKKYYLNDGIFKSYISSTYTQDIGRYLENALYVHYVSQGYTVYVGSLYNTEVDFVLEKGNIKKYVQISYLLSDQKVVQREFGNLEKIKDSHEKIVISLDDVKIENEQGIKHARPWEL